MSLRTSLPIYTTRPHSPHAETATWSMSAWMILLAMYLAWANVVAWGGIGLVYAAKVIL